MEWQCQIRTGKAVLHVPFTGGTQTEYGVTPAKYSTNSPVVQAMIERSDYFRKGRIVLLNTAKTAAAKASAASASAKDGVGGTNTEKAFSTLADAKEWLVAEFGVTQSIRTIADAVAAAASNGVTLTIGTKR